MRNPAILIGAGAMLAACASVPADPATGALEDMLAADRDFAQMAADESIPAAFAAYASDEVHMFPDGGQPYQGRDKLIARFAGWPDGLVLSWEPAGGMASDSGDFGFTWGRFVLQPPEGHAEVEDSHGKYVSVWRKEADGWKFVVDIGNNNPAPQ